MRVAILGAGRIADVHAKGAVLAGADLAGIYDIRSEVAEKLAARYSTKAFGSAAQIFEDRSIDAVAIATSTDTHADYIVSAAHAGKAILCEKPIDLSVARVEECQKKIEGTAAFIQIGFNRRFDPTFAKVAGAVRDGQIGRVENPTLISRDPAPAPIEYYKVSGGIFKDMTIHDFDMARFILPEEPTHVFAIGSVLLREELGAIGDFDTITVVLTTASGIQCQIINSRHCPFGFDQRIEAFGARGVIQADNLRVDEVRVYGDDFTDRRSRLPDFFLQRYAESYNREWQGFLECVKQGRPPLVSFNDGLIALKIAEAAKESVRSGSCVLID
jgi:myo-inositol 2-dehydrogenase/D-chiro-inositol 1-dehydrogenase